jgi:hypothetical protein
MTLTYIPAAITRKVFRDFGVAQPVLHGLRVVQLER